MIAHVTRAESDSPGRRNVFAAATLPQRAGHVGRDRADHPRRLRAADGAAEGELERFVLDFRTPATEIRNFVWRRTWRATASAGGDARPLIRTKNRPLVVPAPGAGELDGFKAAVREAVADYVARYDAISRATTRRVGGRRPSSTRCRAWCWCRAWVCSASAPPKDAAIAADLAETAVEVITDAEAIGRFEPSARERPVRRRILVPGAGQARRARAKPLAGQVAVVTGGGGGIGAATAKAFAAEGAAVAVLDLDEAPPRRRRKSIGGGARLSPATSPTRNGARRLRRVAERFGGVDIVVSNAGAAWQGKIGEVDDEVLRKSFELNFFAHQAVAQERSPSCWRRAPAAACCSTSPSRRSIPGPDFGPYGLPKAATLFLVRQYALDYGNDGIRSNAVNADRIRTGLLTDDMVATRQGARRVREGLHGRQPARARGHAPTWRRPSWRWPRRRTTAASPRSTAATSRRRCDNA